MSFWRQQRCLRDAVKLLIVTLPLAGCMLPTYQQPQGFSSTYYRYLQQGSMGGAFLPGALGPVMPGQPAMMPPPLQPSSPVMEPQLNIPPAPAEKASANNSGVWWSWLRKPVSYRSHREVEDLSTDDEE